MRTRPLTTTEAAARLGRSRETARRLAANGHLDGEKAGRDWLIEASSVAARTGPRVELRQCERDIAYYEKVIEERPTGSEGARRMLKAELEHRDRVLSRIGQTRDRP